MKLQPTETQAKITMTKPRIIKNIVVLSSGALVLFTAYDGLTMLQSTMNGSQGLGVASQAVLYFCFCISALIFPKYVIKRLGSKLTLILSMASYIPYVASNFYPQWSVMIPTSVILGFGAALLWGSQANYINDVATMYAELLISEKNAEIESGKVSENESEDNETKKDILDKTNINTNNKSQKQINLEIGSRLGNPSASELEGIKCPLKIKTESSINGKLRKLSNSGCQCISCVYIEYDDTDTYLIENQPESGKTKVKSAQENDPTNDDALSTGPPLSSSECCISAKNRQKQQNLEEFKQNYINENEFENKYSKLKEQTIDLNATINEVASNQITTKEHDTSISNSSNNKRKLNNSSGTNKEKTTYIDSSCNNNLSQNNSNERKRIIESTTARFFGIHGLFFLSCSIWSNLMSYGVLHSGEHQTSTFASINATCGVGFCGFQSQEHQVRHQPSNETRYALTGVCVTLGVASVALVATFLDALDDKNKKERFSLQLLMATMSLAKRGKLLMLMPLSFYLGMSKGFYTADFTKAFVGCALGTTHVGLVTVCYGAACALSSITSGALVRKCGRAPIFAVGGAANACACVLMLWWTPSGAETELVLFGLAALWGCHAGTVWSQIRAFYGVLYKADEEAAFATFHTWYSLGFCLSFAYSEFLCTYIKVCVLLGISTIGYIGYFWVERKHSRKLNK